MSRLALVALLAACGAPMTPEERGIEVDDDIELSRQGDVLALVQRVVESHYQIELGSLTRNVYWATTACDGKYNVVWGDVCKGGLTWSCEEMYVAISQWTPTTTCGTALVHEFGHCLHDSMTGTLDAKHADKEFWGTISSAYVATCAAGW